VWRDTTQEGLKPLIEVALAASKLVEHTGRKEPTVITVRFPGIETNAFYSLFHSRRLLNSPKAKVRSAGTLAKIEVALAASKLVEHTGRKEPTVITVRPMSFFPLPSLPGDLT
jgi:hypothetical protein